MIDRHTENRCVGTTPTSEQSVSWKVYSLYAIDFTFQFLSVGKTLKSKSQPALVGHHGSTEASWMTLQHQRDHQRVNPSASRVLTQPTHSP